MKVHSVTKPLFESGALTKLDLSAAIPGRKRTSFERLPFWVLLFKTPYSAACYQSRLRWYHQNAVKNLPMSPLQASLAPNRGLMPPPGYIDPESGEDVWKRLREYSVLHPQQPFRIRAMLPPFPESILEPIKYHESWIMQHGANGESVRVWVDGQVLQTKQVENFLEEDGKIRSRPWDMIGGCTSLKSGTSFTEQDRAVGLSFRSKREATRFWRTWHLKPVPSLIGPSSSDQGSAPLLHVEMFW